MQILRLKRQFLKQFQVIYKSESAKLDLKTWDSDGINQGLTKGKAKIFQMQWSIKEVLYSQDED